MVALNNRQTMLMTLGLSRRMNGFTLPIVTLGVMPRVSALNCTAKPKSLAVWACLGVDPLDMPRTPYRASEEKRSQ